MVDVTDMSGVEAFLAADITDVLSAAKAADDGFLSSKRPMCFGVGDCFFQGNAHPEKTDMPSWHHFGSILEGFGPHF